MDIISAKNHSKKSAPIKILQFGEGNFLRAFIDWMIQKMNDSGKYTGHVALVQPLGAGRVEELMKQDGLYTVILQGLVNGEAYRNNEIIDVIDDGVNPYADYKKYLDFGRSEDLEVVISNTTEAGITFEPSDVDIDMDTTCPLSYPGKLLALLKVRFTKLGKEKPLAIIPCELIDDNGDHLKEVLIRLCKERNESQEFTDYVANDCAYTSTLVDRIVPGFPREEFDDLCKEYGYIDNNMVKAECFNLFVLRKEERVMKAFPVHQCGNGVEAYYVDDVHPYKKRKVRVLNGAHTSLVPVAYLSGFDEVRESLLDEKMEKFLKGLIYNEVVPTIEVEGIKKFADDVFSRFLNPYVHHKLMSIALNSLPKFKERDLPTLLDNVEAHKDPKCLEFALAALILFYRGNRVKDGGEEKIVLNDSASNLEFMSKVWESYKAHNDVKKVVTDVLSNVEIWEQDLTKVDSLVINVTKYLQSQIENGVYNAVEEVI